jgi:ATP-dependent protease HslVU (ClpYQ) peptidase subunit
MTILCAMNEPGVGTWYASDSLVTTFGEMNYRVSTKARKWLRGEGFAWGFAGSWAAVTTISESLEEVEAGWHPARLYRFIREVLVDQGFRGDDKSAGDSMWFNLGSLFVTPKHIYRMDGDGSATISGSGEFAARGSGEFIAEGCAYTLMRRGEAPKEIVTEAVRAAIALDTRCGGEIYVGLMGEPHIISSAEVIEGYAHELANIEQRKAQIIENWNKTPPKLG